MASTKPKPTRVKILEGNPGKRALPADEPQPGVESDIPPPPKHLSKTAKEEWRRMSVVLHRNGLLTEIDYTALSLYCQAWGRWVDAEEILEKTQMSIKTPDGVIKSGMTCVTTNGNIIQSPYLNIANTAMRDCHKYITEFGMTPSSRTKVSISKQEKKSKFSGLISNCG